jgi:hypothetical protein
VLRNSSDEVRLHSRFLALLLDPKAPHNQGAALLNLLLNRIGIHDFDSKNAIVEVEYQNIDILIRNQNRQAMIIKNKIYAADQDEQLWRYHQPMQAEDYGEIWTMHLILDGSEPSEQSHKSLPVVLLNYKAEILAWLNDCIPLAACGPGVRESIFPIHRATAKADIQQPGWNLHEHIKSTDSVRRNLFVIADINHAFMSVLADLQFDIWERMAARQMNQYPCAGKPDISLTKEAVSTFYNKAKNSKYIAIPFPIMFTKGGVYIELDHRICCGYCDGEQFPDERKLLSALSKEIVPSNRSSENLLWKYSKVNLNFHTPSNEDLALLRDPEARVAIAVSQVDDVYELWQRAWQKYA